MRQRKKEEKKEREERVINEEREMELKIILFFSIVVHTVPKME